MELQSMDISIRHLRKKSLYSHIVLHKKSLYSLIVLHKKSLYSQILLHNKIQYVVGIINIGGAWTHEIGLHPHPLATFN